MQQNKDGPRWDFTSAVALVRSTAVRVLYFMITVVELV